MKKLFGFMLTAFFLSCSNNATDGDPATDTTTMPVDPAVGQDTVQHINRNYGTVPADTSRIDTSRQ